MKRATAILALGIFALAIPATAIAGKTEYPTAFTKFKFKNGETFAGNIGSTKGKCIEDRKISLYREKGDGDKEKIGKDQTNSNGHFAIDHPKPKQGTYFAKVNEKDYDNKGFTCNKRKSGTLKVSTS